MLVGRAVTTNYLQVRANVTLKSLQRTRAQCVTMKTTLNITISWSVFALMLVGAVATYQSADPPGNEPKLLITGGRRAISRRLSPPLRAGAPPGVQQFQQQSNTQPGSYNLPDVSATCSASDLVLRVKPTFYGLFADKEELKLGDNCESNGVLRPYGDLLFTYPLTACGAVRQVGPRLSAEQRPAAD